MIPLEEVSNVYLFARLLHIPLFAVFLQMETAITEEREEEEEEREKERKRERKRERKNERKRKKIK